MVRCNLSSAFDYYANARTTKVILYIKVLNIIVSLQSPGGGILKSDLLLLYNVISVVVVVVEFT